MYSPGLSRKWNAMMVRSPTALYRGLDELIPCFKSQTGTERGIANLRFGGGSNFLKPLRSYLIFCV